MHVDKVYKTLARLLVIPVHGVDGLGQFSAVSLVDTACVDPDMFISMLSSCIAETLYLFEAGLEVIGELSESSHLRERDLILTPGMR